MNTIDYIDTFHQDIVHDISFDWYGNRIATCSSDRKVKIFYKIDNSHWKKIYEFTAHDAEVRKVKWAHPDFGSIIATCSYDKSVIIWEEPKLNTILVNGVLHPKENENNSWIYKTKLLDSKESIEDIKFAPKHLGLMLATASAEGIFRIYEAPDLMNTASWRMIHEENAWFYGINSISWSKNPFEPPMLAIGCKDPSTSFQKELGKDLAPISPLRIYASLDKWKFCRSLPENEEKFCKIQHKAGVNDVSWAGINGRSFELIVSGGRDGIIVWYLKFIEENRLSLFKAEMLNNNEVGVWKVSWNVMATILASSDEKNAVKIWKSSGDKWRCIGVMKEEHNELEEKKKNEDDNDEDGEFHMSFNN